MLSVGCNNGLSGSNTTDGGSGSGGDASVKLGLQIMPSVLQTLDVTLGQSNKGIAFTATDGGRPASAVWTLDRGDIAAIAVGPAPMTTVTALGTVGGLVTVSAVFNGQTASCQVLVRVSGTQNGANSSNPAEAQQIPANVGALSAGGGVGGVGGEGLGVAVSNPATLTALAHPTGTAQSQNLTLLYPYNNTVWPRGMLAPLLMWSWTPGNADAIQITVSTTSGSFNWTGTFGPPAILASTGGPFIRNPIPQDIWSYATNTAGSVTQTGAIDKLTVSLTVAKGGVGYGPIQVTFGVAAATLSGTVYYNSYGTQLVKNWVNTDSAGNPVGAAILSVRSGDTGPQLVIGQNSPLNANGIPTSDTGCRVCHVMAARGRWLIAQSEGATPGDGQSYLYDLTAANIQSSAATIPQLGTFAWAAMVADGSYALTNMINPSSSNAAINQSMSDLWQFGATPSNSMPPSGLPANVAAGYPSYSPDDGYIAYIDVTGSTGNVKGPLNVAAYNSATHAFSGVTTLATPPAGERYGYPAFLPDDSGVVFEDEVRTSQTDTVMVTRNGARSHIAWVNRSGTPKVFLLNNLNGSGYLPLGPNNHGADLATDPQSSYSEAGLDDTTLNYEPTILPIVVGGYAWVVFTSRRMYGNQLQAVPYRSWPPDYNTRDLTQATVKKIWVAAIDLNAAPGTDPSHPAFYLPAQEILAGNSRGLWVLDPCLKNGASCQTGDQCCNGFCEPNGAGGALVCSSATTGQCSMVQEACTTAANCCDSTNQCINGFCASILG